MKTNPRSQKRFFVLLLIPLLALVATGHSVVRAEYVGCGIVYAYYNCHDCKENWECFCHYTNFVCEPELDCLEDNRLFRETPYQNYETYSILVYCYTYKPCYSEAPTEFCEEVVYPCEEEDEWAFWGFGIRYVSIGWCGA